MTTVSPLPTNLLERYRTERELGRGGMGVVLLARDLELDRRVVIKLALRPEDSAIRDRMAREAATLSALEHPNVVRILASGDTNEGAYLVMEYIAGGSLETPPPGTDLASVFTLHP